MKKWISRLTIMMIWFSLLLNAGCDRRWSKGRPECEACPEPNPCDVHISLSEQQWALKCITQTATLGKGEYVDECVEAAALIHRKCVIDL